MKTLKKSQSGGGLISVLVAVALLAITAGAISYFVMNLKNISVNLGAKSSCSEIANTLSNYMRQDGASTFIYSIGIDPDGTFADYASSLANVDGNPMFALGGQYANSQVVNMSVTTLTAPNSATPIASVLPAGATFQLLNYLNIRNGVSRMVSLATQGALCEDTIVFDNSNKATINLLDGVTVDKPDLQVQLRADFLEGGGSLCGKTGLDRLPTLQRGLVIKYVVKVTLNANQPKAEECNATGALNISSDPTAPMTVMNITSIDPVNRCTTQVGTSAYCVSGVKRQSNDIVATVRTVQPSAACTSCLRTNSARYASCGTDVLNTNLETACASQCPDTDPGSVFFCKLIHREQTSGLSNWWPCHRKPTGIPGVVSITYQDISGSLSSTQTTTQASIRVSGLPSARDWLLDVRAIDTAGAQLGPSFSSISSSAVPTDEVPYEIPTGFRDCSCDGSCKWNPISSTGVCPTSPAPACPVGVAANFPLPVAPYTISQVFQCEHPGFPGVSISDTNCVFPKPPSDTNCTLPCVAATPPTYACDFSSPTFGACSGTPPTRLRTGVCRQGAGGPIVAASNCTGTSDCTGPVSCTPPPVIVSCQNWIWTECTPTCTQSCTSTAVAECLDTDGNSYDTANCPNSCRDSRTDYATNCAFTCDTTTVVASECSAGPCDLLGTKTYTGAVCRDTNNGNAIVDVANCGGNCNPAPTSCDRGCAFSCVPSGNWLPEPCSTPCGATTPNQRSRPSTCKFTPDGTACVSPCADITEDCSPVSCNACGAIAHGGTKTVETYTSATGTCADGCVSSPQLQTCTNGVFTPDLSSAILSCTARAGCLNCGGYRMGGDITNGDAGYSCSPSGTCACNSIPDDPCSFTLQQPDGTQTTCTGKMSGGFEYGTCGQGGGNPNDCDCHYTSQCQSSQP